MILSFRYFCNPKTVINMISLYFGFDDTQDSFPRLCNMFSLGTCHADGHRTSGLLATSLTLIPDRGLRLT
ncbi:hypothetical protein L6452_35665 [Arctium lappa]|uniref:Uncharacterized protein n=1 Tax=Arctium lappa TaxID=4217 RepID=A0ACB8Y7S6_ARCLA|nr:hypothetical protein L6452_35665 [Arctium lappa]